MTLRLFITLSWCDGVHLCVVCRMARHQAGVRTAGAMMGVADPEREKGASTMPDRGGKPSKGTPADKRKKGMGKRPGPKPGKGK